MYADHEGLELPLNKGLMTDVEIVNSEVNPHHTECASTSCAIGRGNTEASQRLVDTLFRSLNVVACSQGSMNSFLFGDEQGTYSYYETIGGGTGAGFYAMDKHNEGSAGQADFAGQAGFAGRAGVRQHMTNTKITDVEELERRFPVLLREFSIRRGSGGAGKYRGGDGLKRVLEFQRPVSVSLLTEHGRVPPYGIDGAGPGQAGTQFWWHCNEHTQVDKGMDPHKDPNRYTNRDMDRDTCKYREQTFIRSIEFCRL